MRTILNHVRIIDGLGNPPIEDGYLIIEDKSITAFGTFIKQEAQESDITHDLGGLTLLPGLIDAHVHIYATGKEIRQTERPPKYASQLSQLICADNLRSHIQAGFTTIRDVGSVNDPVWALRHAERAGMIPSPRIVASGKLLTVTAGHGTEYGVDMAWECDGEADLIKGVRRQIAEGADFIKVIASRRSKGHPEGYPAWKLEDLKLAVDEAHDYGLSVAAHASGCAESVALAIDAGADSIEHGWGITQKMMEKAARKGIFLVPTLAVYENLLNFAKEGKWRRNWEDIVKFWGSPEDRENEVRWAKEFGVPIVLGTDAGNPDTFHGDGAIEMAQLVTHGLSPMEAICAATSNAARCCGLEDITGSIEVGKLADLVILAGDPLMDISLLQKFENIKGVYKAGEMVHVPTTIN